jgi:23S rRNA pseudouridine2605 synthase
VTRERSLGPLVKAVAAASGLSRRKAFAAVRAGRVRVGGAVATDPSAPYEGGEIELDGRKLRRGTAEKVYLLMNKPPGVITTVTDTHGRRTVLDLVPVEMRVPGLHPAGRLDRDTTGLLVLTNDGDLTYRLTHPSHEVDKEYWLRSTPPLTEEALQRLRRGVEVDGRVRRPLSAQRLPPESGYETAVTLREGRKRQVRRMVAALGARVTALKRVREGSLRLGDLPEGAVRPLSEGELEALRGGPAQSGRDASQPP